MGAFPGPDTARDAHRFAGGELAVHRGRRYAYALLAPAHPQAVKLTSVEELSKDVGDLRFHNTWPVVLHDDPVTFFPLRLGDLNADVG